MSTERRLHVLVIAIFLVASIIYYLQGGFGGGHGDLDWALYFLALPWSLLRLSSIFSASDYVRFVVMPLFLNLAVLQTLRILKRRLSHRRRADRRLG